MGKENDFSQDVLQEDLSLLYFEACVGEVSDSLGVRMVT